MSKDQLQAGTTGRICDRAVVTGGAGFLGSHLCSMLVKSGAHVVCIDNFLTGSRDNISPLLKDPAFTLIEADVSEPFTVPGSVDLVLSLACPASTPEYLRYPIETLRAGSQGTFNALTLAAQKKAHLVLASTSEVYGDPLVHPQTEDYWGHVNPVGPRAVYDEAKRFSEALTTAFRTHQGLSTGIVRIFNTFGPGMRAKDGRVIPNFINQALSGKPLTVMGNGEQTRSFCYVQDTVHGILAMASSEQPGPVNIGNPEEVTIRDIALRICELAGSSSTVNFIDRYPDDPERRRPDISRARRMLDWSPQFSLDDGLKRTIAWFADGI
jgi:dTDP-glucose 4,6-dehydratase